MFIGFDYGTANCSVAVMNAGTPQLVPLENDSPYLSSLLCAPVREAVSEWLWRHHQVEAGGENALLLRRSINYNHDEDIRVLADSVKFGQSALQQYIADPEETWFVKSPKSFLGAVGLQPQQIALFEDLVCAMMLHIRKQAERQLAQPITQAVIGRPINFQSIGGEEANQQAQGILARAAARAGFQRVAFQFEPVAAGLDFEATLVKETRVLVVDIGGGTTDCSMLLMGPDWHHQRERQQSLLGHSGCRVGGNDLDIILAFKQLMPVLGMNGMTEKGITLPSQPWWNAVAINDIPAQKAFYSTACRTLINEMIRDAQQPEAVKRLLTVWRQRLGYRLVQLAEACKITLSDEALAAADLHFVEPGLTTAVSHSELNAAIEQPLLRIQQQIELALKTSQTLPDVIYLTGGSARSPLLRQAIERLLPDIPIAGGNDFGSVTAGLARWADVLFRD
ncbi:MULTISPECIES: molecular chaperone [unclassified Brenneria]|uniref:molecular chaperone n=1 Tax=unclassified Brenneria TaxID=2634434 RepID=UPI0029C1100B|nr:MULTISPECIES: molecular chaperone [unclassified Brenneria]MDX5627390.1 molecular chaperone [Brenneria sp. L3-3Z]MDX5694454.1 molecular chaperone [Brenneria sp. L4-2C]